MFERDVGYLNWNVGAESELRRQVCFCRVSVFYRKPALLMVISINREGTYYCRILILEIRK